MNYVKILNISRTDVGDVKRCRSQFEIRFTYNIHVLLGTDCPEPSAPTRGKVVGSQSTIGSTIRYECNIGYTFAQNTIPYATCQPNKQWSNPTPSCTSKF